MEVLERGRHFLRNQDAFYRVFGYCAWGLSIFQPVEKVGTPPPHLHQQCTDWKLTCRQGLLSFLISSFLLTGRKERGSSCFHCFPCVSAQQKVLSNHSSAYRFTKCLFLREIWFWEKAMHVIHLLSSKGIVLKPLSFSETEDSNAFLIAANID